MPESLARHFVGIAYKLLSAVEADRSRSNQHEFDGVENLKRLLGPDRRTFEGRFVFLADDDAPATADGPLTWYDARESHPSRSEYRLYFRDNEVMERASAGDLAIVARSKTDELLVAVCRAGSTVESQLRLLFGIEDPQLGVEFLDLREAAADLDPIRALLLEQLGIEPDVVKADLLGGLLARFPDGLPRTAVFSAYARETLPEVASQDDPDGALLAWWEREELLFRTLERHLVSIRLGEGFGDDVDAFIAYSLRVHQIRKSRAGHALENHVEQVLKDHRVRFARGAITENKARPDFLFPGQEAYLDPGFASDRLTMLGVKSTCKDRWRQVLTEANRIDRKHLLTLEVAISGAQLDEMQSNGLTLVLPSPLHETIDRQRRDRLMSVRELILMVRSRQ